jgi:hypothetical protein
MRHRPSVDNSSDKSEYVESDVDNGVGLDTDLTDVDRCTDEDNKDDEDDKQCEGTEDEAWLFPDEDHPPEHYLQQLETFDEREYTKEDYKDSSTRLLNRMEDQWNQ